jgi:hypothetical protein
MAMFYLLFIYIGSIKRIKTQHLGFETLRNMN